MLLLLLVLGVVAAFIYSLVVNRLRGLPPGPTPLPLIGNILSLDENMDKVLLGWKEKYGKVFTIWMPYPTIVISDSELLKTTVVKEGDVYGDRQPLEEGMKLLVGGNYGLIMNGNDMWKEQRRFAIHALKDLGFGTTSMQDTINFLAHRAISYLKNLDGQPIDLEPHYTSCVGNVITMLTFGRVGEHLDESIAQFKHNITSQLRLTGKPSFQALEFIPALQHADFLVGMNLKEIRKYNSSMFAFVDEQIAEREAQIDWEMPPKCYVDAFLIEMRRRQKMSEDEGTFTRHQLRVAAIDLYAAGLETTMTTLRFATVYLLNNPHVQEKLHAEIKEKIGMRDAVMEDQKRLPYTCAVQQEVQRLGNFLPVNFMRQLAEDADIDGYHIPAGTALIPQFQSVHMDPSLYPRPHLFWPDRHLNERSEFVKDSRITPFSVGKRSCLGEGLARMEVFLFLVAFTQHFRFVPEDVVPPKMEIVPGFLRGPKPFKCRLIPRDA